MYGCSQETGCSEQDGRAKGYEQEAQSHQSGDFQQEVGCEPGVKGMGKQASETTQGLGDGAAPACRLGRERRLPVQ